VPSGSRTRQVDAVIDLVGGETQARSFAFLRPGGILVSGVSKPDQAEETRRGVRALFFLVNVTAARLTRIDADELIADVGVTLPLASDARAHEMLEGLRQHPRGTIVLRTGTRSAPRLRQMPAGEARLRAALALSPGSTDRAGPRASG
jgi:NADPH:quinone reductase-like Zn-dependent oxidoreductase